MNDTDTGSAAADDDHRSDENAGEGEDGTGKQGQSRDWKWVVRLVRTYVFRIRTRLPWQ